MDYLGWLRYVCGRGCLPDYSQQCLHDEEFVAEDCLEIVCENVWVLVYPKCKNVGGIEQASSELYLRNAYEINNRYSIRFKNTLILA